jgi:hypothetical protein
LRLLRELDCPTEYKIVRNAVAFLLTTYDDEAHVWRAVPADTNSFAHAPWWHDQEGSLEKLFDGFRIIPRVLILASLHHYSALVPMEWLEDITKETVRYIETVEVLGIGGGSDLRYMSNLAEARNFPPNYSARLRTRIQKGIPATVVRDPEKWDSYGAAPIRLAQSPESIGAHLIQDELQLHLDYLIDHQSPEGNWDPTWTWGGSYPEAWEHAKQDWRGHLTLETLTALRAFGRIKG